MRGRQTRSSSPGAYRLGARGTRDSLAALLLFPDARVFWYHQGELEKSWFFYPLLPGTQDQTASSFQRLVALSLVHLGPNPRAWQIAQLGGNLHQHFSAPQWPSEEMQGLVLHGRRVGAIRPEVAGRKWPLTHSHSSPRPLFSSCSSP